MTIKDVVEELNHVDSAIKHLEATKVSRDVYVILDKEIVEEIIDFLEDYRELIYAKKKLFGIRRRNNGTNI